MTTKDRDSGLIFHVLLLGSPNILQNFFISSGQTGISSEKCVF
jgi:hypothetical protein